MIKRYFNKKVLCMVLGLFLVVIACCVNIVIGGFLLLLGGANIFMFYVYRSKIPNIFRESKRDYDGLIIGSKSISKGEEEKMLCVSFDRSLQMSRLILERMYSFLKKDGKVTFYINLYKDRIKGINPSDIYYLHRVTVSELGIKFFRVKYFFPLLANPVYAFNYLIWIINGEGVRRKKEKEISDIIEWIVSTKLFCEERELKAEFLLYGKRENIIRIKEAAGVGDAVVLTAME